MESGTEMLTLQDRFGPIDIYLFDQLLRGNIPPGAAILDAGCGGGRNLVYFLRSGHPVFGADLEPLAVESVRGLAASLAPQLPPTNFRHEPVEAMTFPDASAAVVLLSAVLHFARDEQHFRGMLHGAWRVLEPGGLLFCRLASTIGVERQIRRIEQRRYLLPDGSERFLADEELLMNLTAALGGELVDPLKTTVVQNQRAMTTWVLRKSPRTA